MTEGTRQKEAAALKKLYKAVEYEKQLSHPKLAELMGTDKSQISHMLNGRNPINLERALQFCKHLNITLENFSPRLAAQAAALQKAIGHVEDVSGDVGFLADLKGKAVLDVLQGNETAPMSIYWAGKHSSETYALRVEGESNAPEMPHGSIAIVDTQQEPEAGDVCCYLTGKNLHYAKNLGDGHYEFANKDYPNRIFKKTNKMNIIGKVIGQMKSF